MIVVKIGILVFKATHRRSSVVRVKNSAIFYIGSLSVAHLAIFQVGFTHSEITIIADEYVVARGTTTIVPVSDFDVAINVDASAV